MPSALTRGTVVLRQAEQMQAVKVKRACFNLASK